MHFIERGYFQCQQCGCCSMMPLFIGSSDSLSFEVQIHQASSQFVCSLLYTEKIYQPYNLQIFLIFVRITSHDLKCLGIIVMYFLPLLEIIFQL